MLISMTFVLDRGLVAERDGNGLRRMQPDRAYWNNIGPFGGWTAAVLMKAMLEDAQALAAEMQPVSQTVDYMAMSIKLRKSWQLSMEEQTHFAGFEFLSAGMVEEELKATLARDTGAGSFRQTGGSFRARATA